MLTAKCWVANISNSANKFKQKTEYGEKRNTTGEKVR